MIAMAFSLFDSDNLIPFGPHGGSGVLKGAIAAFFGYLGFDEVSVERLLGCCRSCCGPRSCELEALRDDFRRLQGDAR